MRYLQCPLCLKWFVTRITYGKTGVKELCDCPHCGKYSANGKHYGKGTKL